VLVLSSADFNLAHGHLVAGMITTGARSSWPSDEPIQDLAAAGLRHPSVVRFKLFTLGHQVIAKRVGSLGVEDRRRVSGKLDTVLLR
jgi:mRNA interferase MazF